MLGVLGVLGGCKTRLEFKNLNQSIPCFYFLIFTGGHVFKVMLVDNVGVFTKETFTISAYSSIGPVKTHVADTSITKGPALYLVSFTGRDPLTTRLIVEAPVGSCVDIQSVSVTPKPVCAVRRLCACVCGTSPVCLCVRYVACVPVCAVRRLCACVRGTSPVCLCVRYVTCVPVCAVRRLCACVPKQFAYRTPIFCFVG